MKKYFLHKITLLLFLSLGLSIQSIAQVPTNDDPCSAIGLTVGASCSLVEYTNENATDFGGDNPGCGFYQGTDVWFNLTVPASGKLIVDLAPGTNSLPQVAAYTGSCSSLSVLECNSASSSNGGNVGRLNINDITLAGQTLHFMVFRRSSPIGGTFEICAWEPFIPDNDFCSNAVSIPVNASCSFTEYTSLHCTGDAADGNPSCAFYQGVDVWFTLTVPASGKMIIDLNPGTNNTPALSLYQGTCGAITQYVCNASSSSNGGNVGRININDISLANEIMYVRVWPRSSVDGGTFEICAWEPFIPDNDFCANAVTIPVNASCSFTEYTSLNCTGDAADGNPSCAFYQGVDVWFIVTVPASGKMIIDLNPGTNNTPALSLYQGTCGAITEYKCNAASSSNGGNVGRININDPSIANETMYIRVWPRSSVDGGTFEICAWEPFIPDYDFCANAVPLSVDATCVFSDTYTSLHCTGDNNDPNPPCAFYQGVDVWFTITIPASGKLIVDLNPGTLNTPALALYQGTCGAVTVYDCNQSSSSNGGNVGRITINDISVANETMYVRVWPRSSVDGGTFQICGWEPFIPDNDFCVNAIPILVQSECILEEYTNLHATKNDDHSNPSCGFFQDADVWFTTIMPASGHLVIDLGPGTLGTPALAVYSGDCLTLNQEYCDQTRSTNGGNVGKVTIHNDALAGQLLYIRVWPRSDVDGGTFSICAWEPDIPDNDFCADAFDLTVQGVECNLQTYSNANCTDSPSADSGPNPTCSFYQGVDVWFTTTIPADGQLIIDLGPLEINSPNLAVYTGVCGSLVQYDCDSNSSSNGSNVGQIIIADISLAGQVVYIKVWNRSSTVGGEFQICAFNPNYCGFFDVMVGVQGTCNPIEENYTQEVSFSYLNSPVSGDVVVNGQSFAITPSPMTITLTDLPSNNQNIDLYIEFSNEIECYYLDDNAWFAPICCEGDANFDGQVNVLDLIAISSDFGCTGLCDGDVNVDGEVNILDLIAVSSNFGNNCLE